MTHDREEQSSRSNDLISSHCGLYVKTPKELVDEIFSVDRAIRYVGIVGPGPKFQLLESRMRSDLKSLTPETTDREFVEVIPQLVVGAAEKL